MQLTGSGALGGTGTVNLVAGTLSFIVGGGWKFFLSSDNLSELPADPCPVLSLGLSQCIEVFSSRPLEGDFGLPSLETHLFSSYLQELAIVST